MPNLTDVEEGSASGYGRIAAVLVQTALKGLFTWTNTLANGISAYLELWMFASPEKQDTRKPLLFLGGKIWYGLLYKAKDDLSDSTADE